MPGGLPGWAGEGGGVLNLLIDWLITSLFGVFFILETKAKIVAERDRASAESSFKALDTDEDGR